MTDASPSGWSPEEATDGEAAPGAGVREPLGDVIRRLIEDFRTYLTTEAARQKLRATFLATNVRDIVILGSLALFLTFASVVALLIGLIVALAPVIGPWWALLAVIGGAMLAVAGLAALMWSRVRRLTGKSAVIEVAHEA